VDKDAVAKRKRLQALKDKQEDERAEKGDDDKSSSRFVKGRAYGGAAQKDDEDKDLDESGLQAYLGKKKYGKEGMKALQQAGRDGAGKEKMAIIRAKHDKFNESAKPDFLDVDKDGNKKEAFKKAVKDKKEVEEGIKFGDTIKNSAGKMTKAKVTVKEGKDAIRNHPIYTTKEAWDHYSQELAEQEMMEQSMTEAPVVDVQEELNEIARLAGLAPKMEAKCSSCGCADCKCNEDVMDESTRKHFRAAADMIKTLVDAGHKEKALEKAKIHDEIFARENPRYDSKKFFDACGLDIEECGMAPATVLVGEEEMDEGNEFTKARLDAIAAGKDTFTVGAKTYKVSGDTSDEKTQVESVNEDININVTANGEEDVVNLIRKLSGLEAIKTVTDKISAMSGEACGACGTTPCGCEEQVEEERDIEHTNTPREITAPLSAAIPSGDGENRSKQQYSKEYMGDNHMAVKEEALWKSYQELISDIKS
jgi:hypothetical protein